MSYRQDLRNEAVFPSDLSPLPAHLHDDVTAATRRVQATFVCERLAPCYFGHRLQRSVTPIQPNWANLHINGAVRLTTDVQYQWLMRLDWWLVDWIAYAFWTDTSNYLFISAGYRNSDQVFAGLLPCLYRIWYNVCLLRCRDCRVGHGHLSVSRRWSR